MHKIFLLSGLSLLSAIFVAPLIVLAQPQVSIGGFSVLAACDPLQDSDNDGVFDCDDQCPSDSAKIVPGDCGCGLFEIDLNVDGIIECAEPCQFDDTLPDGGFCSCPFYDVLVKLLALPSLCQNFPPLTRRTIINDPPGVVVVRDAEGGTSVQLFFQRFGGALGSLRTASALSATANPAIRPNNVKLKVRYEVQIFDQTLQKLVLKRLSKRNKLTLRGLKTGSYSVKYRASGLKDEKVVFKTKFSPSQNFEVP